MPLFTFVTDTLVFIAAWYDPMQLPHNVLVEFFITAAGGSRAKETAVVRTSFFTLRLTTGGVCAKFSYRSAYQKTEIPPWRIFRLEKNMPDVILSYEQLPFSSIERIRQSLRSRWHLSPQEHGVEARQGEMNCYHTGYLLF